MTTIYDVARVAGVSTATVSRVLRGSDRVRADTRQRVLAVIETLGFVPDASARGLTRRRKDIIGLVALDRGADEIDIERTSLLFVDHIVHAAEAVLRGTEYSLLLTFGSRGEQFERRVRSLVGQVDGLLIAEEVLDDGELRALAGQIPLVVIAGSRDQTAADVFLGDNIGGMTALAGHLIEQHGHHRLCFVAGPKDAPDAAERQLAFEQAVAASPDSGIDQVIHGDFSEDSGIAAARILLGRRSLPQAVVCANDQMAIGVLRELQRADVRIPADVAVTGFDDVHASRVVDPPLTTVSQPFRDLGGRATHRLLARIGEPALAPRAEVLPTQVVIRASCGCPPRQQRLGRPQRPRPGRRIFMRSHLITLMWRGINPWGARKDKRRPRRAAALAAVIALGPVAVLAAVAGTALPASATTVPPPPSGWTTAFSDSFSGPAGSGADSNWTYDTGTQYSGTGCTGNWGTGEVETNTSSTANVAEDGSGHLNITAVNSGGSWTSGRIETVADSFAAPAGGEMEVTASIKQPNPSSGLGYWPAFWMLGSGFRASGAGTSGTMNCSNWPSAGEIDIMEDVNALSEHSGTLHCGTDPGGPCNETNGLSSGLQSCSGCQAGYNTYSVIVNRTNTGDESITWYLNGNAYYTVTESQVGAATWQAAVDHGFFLILDLAMGGGYPNGVCGCGTPASSTSSGAAMSVGYVAVYTTAGSGGSGGSGGGSGGGGGGGGGGTSCATTATSDISADCYSASQGTINVTSATGDSNPGGVDGNQVAQLSNGDYLEYSGINFGSGSTQFDARVASGAAGGVSGLVEVVLDNPSNTPVGSFAVANTGGWTSWRTIPANISQVTGTHNVYLKFVSGAGGNPPYVSLHYFNFPVS
jgi:DNA-binding LacI/PurR family transcriptional regulator